MAFNIEADCVLLWLEGLNITTQRAHQHSLEDFSDYLEDEFSNVNQYDTVVQYGLKLYSVDNFKCSTIWSVLSPIKTVYTLLGLGLMLSYIQFVFFIVIYSSIGDITDKLKLLNKKLSQWTKLEEVKQSQVTLFVLIFNCTNYFHM